MAVDLANLSDEDFLNVDPSTLAFNTEEPPQDDPAEPAEPAPADEDDVPVDPPVEVNPDEDDTPAPNPSDDDAPVDPSDDPAPNPADPAEDDAEVKAPAKVEPAKVEEADPVKDFFAKVTAPFKANGREMKVENADEAIRLMQMGANYNKKMAALKPNLQLMKSLESAGLLSQDKIDFLIDVMAKKPEAISKLVQDSGIDPLDISTEKAGEYRPTSYRVSDKSMALDEVLDDLKGSPHYAATLGFVADQLDEASKQIVADSPEVLRKLHQHIADGVFDQVWPEVERQKAIGTLSGLSDLEAYRQVGDAMAKSGKLQLPAQVAPAPSTVTAPAKVVVPPKPKQADDSDRRTKRQDASPTKAAAPSSNSLPRDFNPLAMSDEEIAKLDISKLR